jgi:hypothetical protein
LHQDDNAPSIHQNRNKQAIHRSRRSVTTGSGSLCVLPSSSAVLVSGNKKWAKGPLHELRNCSSTDKV